jgi:hypothetical protein
MINRILTNTFILILTGAITISCSEDIPDCPSRMCIIAGGWQLREVYVDDDRYEGDLTQYRLRLEMPAPTTETSAAFSRIQPSGATDDGTWSLENNASILRLVPDNNQLLAEDWVIERMTPRQMVLIIVRDVGIKEGPGKIEFFLEPI